jgi:hypothetical protein
LIAFTGDLGFNGTHPYTADGHTTARLQALDVLTRELSQVSTVLPRSCRSACRRWTNADR